MFIVTFKRKEVSELEGSTTQKTTQKILALIRANPQISRKELAAALGITQDGVKFHLANLKKQAVLKRIGPDKGGHWEVQNGG